jgi:hypothetical protein
MHVPQVFLEHEADEQLMGAPKYPSLHVETSPT